MVYMHSSIEIRHYAVIISYYLATPLCTVECTVESLKHSIRMLLGTFMFIPTAIWLRLVSPTEEIELVQLNCITVYVLGTLVGIIMIAEVQ